MSCPPGSLNGFANLTTIPGQSDLDSITINNTPFILNFAKRGVPLQMQGNSIMEDVANTIMYLGKQFTLYTTKICKPQITTTYYDLYGTQKPSLANLMFTYINTRAITSGIEEYKAGRNQTEVISIILILPIYVGNTPSANAPYLTQIKNNTIQAVYPSLKLLFNKLKCIGYPGCFDCVLSPNNPRTFGCRTYIYNFIDGITLSQADWNSLTSSMTPDLYTFIDVELITTYNGDGTPNLTTTRRSPKILESIPITDDKFKTGMNYYTVPLYPPPQGTKVNTDLAPNKFQCYPFDELYNLQRGADPSQDKIVNLGEAIKSRDTQNNTVGAMVSWDKLIIFVYIIIGCVGGLFVFGVAFWFITKYLTRTRASVATAAAAAVGPATVGAAVVGAAAVGAAAPPPIASAPPPVKAPITASVKASVPPPAPITASIKAPVKAPG